jgi:hypothetical protein
MAVAGQPGHLDESEPLVEAAVRLGGRTARVATHGAEGGGAPTLADTRLDHDRSPGPITPLAEDRSIRRRPLAREEAANLSAFLIAETVGDRGGGLLGQFGTSLGERPWDRRSSTSRTPLTTPTSAGGGRET